jgi:hypothetical protein
MLGFKRAVILAALFGSILTYSNSNSPISLDFRGLQLEYQNLDSELKEIALPLIEKYFDVSKNLDKFKQLLKESYDKTALLNTEKQEAIQKVIFTLKWTEPGEVKHFLENSNSQNLEAKDLIDEYKHFNGLTKQLINEMLKGNLDVTDLKRVLTKNPAYKNSKNFWKAYRFYEYSFNALDRKNQKIFLDSRHE